MSSQIWTPRYASLALNGTTVIPDTSPNYIWEIILRNVDLPASGQFLALCASGADGSSGDSDSYVWEMSGLASNSTTQQNLNDASGTRDGWRLFFDTNATWTNGRGRLIWDPGACTLDWQTSCIISGISSGKRGSGHRTGATNRRSLILGNTGVTCTGQILYRALV